jgi:hypothetical protein
LKLTQSDIQAMITMQEYFFLRPTPHQPPYVENWLKPNRWRLWLSIW